MTDRQKPAYFHCESRLFFTGPIKEVVKGLVAWVITPMFRRLCLRRRRDGAVKQQYDSAVAMSVCSVCLYDFWKLS